MNADYTPSMHNYKNMGHFKMWCQKVLPLVYDESLSYYEVLCKVIQYINDTTDNVDGLYEDMQDLYSAYNLLQTYVNNYFDNLNVQTEINNKLDAMVLDGTMDELLSPIVGRQIGGVVAEQIGDVVGTQIGEVVANQLPAEVTAQLPDIAAQAASTEVGSWLETHIDPDTGYVIDDTLTVSNAAADSKAVGDNLTELKSALNNNMDMSGVEWVIGSLDPITGNPISSEKRIRSEFLLAYKGTRISVTGNANCLIVYCYSSTKAYISSSEWIDGNVFTVSDDRVNYIRILVRKSDGDQSLTQADVATESARCSVESAIGKNIYQFTFTDEKINDMTDDILENRTSIDDIQDIADAIANVKGRNISESLTWEFGTLNVDSGVKYASTTRIITKDYIDVADIHALDFLIATGYKYAIYCYDSAKNYLKSKSFYNWQTLNRNYLKLDPSVKYIMVLISDTNDGTASLTYAENLNIFEDYKIVEAISKLDVDINHYTGFSCGWEIGTLEPSTGKDLAGNTRIRSKKIKVGKGTVIKDNNPNTYKHLIYLYQLDGTFIIAGSWITEQVTIQYDCLIRILVAYNDNRIITQELVSTISDNEIVEYDIPEGFLAQSDSDTVPKIFEISENVHKKDEITIFKQKKTNAEQWGQCDLKAMLFTDVHGDADRTKRMTELIDNWGSDYFHTIVCCGDIVQTLGTETLDWYYNCFDNTTVPLLNTVGNHDAWSNLNGALLPKTDVYNSLIKPIASGSNIIQPENAEANGYNYYYKDIGTVRIIVVDCMYWDATQLSWFESTLANAKTNGLHVLCISHAAFPLANMQKIDCLWSKSGLNTDSTRTNIQAASAVKSFMDNDGTFIAWIVGHQHGDYVHVMPEYGNQYVINLASFAQRAGWLLKNTDKTKYNYDCLTYLAVDTTNKNVRLNRIGADMDIFGTQYHGLVIDYGTKQLVSSY